MVTPKRELERQLMMMMMKNSNMMKNQWWWQCWWSWYLPKREPEQEGWTDRAPTDNDEKEKDDDGVDVDDDDNDDDGDKDIDDDDGSTKELTRAGRLNRSGAKRYKKFTLNTNTGSIIENYKC